jgi:hypothetical protein
MADLLIAIGGTGQHTALAISRLVFLGVLPRMSLAVIDADDQNELSTNLKTFGQTADGNYGLHPLTNGDKIYPPFDRGVMKDPEFQDLFIQNASPLEREIFELAVDADSAGISVNEGMFGRPSVGATIFAQNRLTQLGPVFEGAQDAEKIFVTGSIVGGTGAGILHQLVKALPADKRIYAIIFLRWFNAALGGSRQTISDGTMERNMRYGLDYFFKDTRTHLKAAVLIGTPDRYPPELAPISVHAGDLSEKNHYFHLAAGYAALKLPKISVTEQLNGSVYATAYEGREQMYDEVWGNDENAKPLGWFVNRARFVKEILDYASDDNFIGQVEATLGRLAIFQKPENIGLGLQQTLLQYPGTERKVRLREIAQTWRVLSRQYEFSLTWLEDVLGRFPVEKYVARYKEVRESPAARVKEIQTLWREPIPMGQTPLSAPEVARAFHQKLVASFV